jgi:hypothetical protein
MQFTTIWVKIAEMGKESHRKDGDGRRPQRWVMALFWAELNIV